MAKRCAAPEIPPDFGCGPYRCTEGGLESKLEDQVVLVAVGIFRFPFWAASGRSPSCEATASHFKTPMWAF
jgi:hypothetical protein